MVNRWVKPRKKKWLFLRFCIKYARFTEFYNDEKQTVFRNYLPVQLDTTCNGFQHIDLLSNEEALFGELSLVKTTKPGKLPGDLCAFLLLKTENYLTDNFLKRIESPEDKSKKVKSTKTKVTKEPSISTPDNRTIKPSYSRLHNFVLTRDNVKKIIMTLPYNITDYAIKTYLEKSLLVSAYTDLYSNDHYLIKFGEGIRRCISGNTHHKWEGRTLLLDGGNTY